MKAILIILAAIALFIIGYTFYQIIPQLSNRHGEMLIVGIATSTVLSSVVGYYWNNPNKMLN